MLRFGVIAGITFLLFVIFYFLIVKGRFADVIVRLLHRILDMDYSNAYMFYFNWIRNYMDLLWIAVVIIIFLISLRIIMNSFTQYFDVINQGISAISDPATEIRMPPEMAATEAKLKEVKASLEKHEMESRLARQRKDELVMYLAHDIRTPLTSVIGYLNLLSEIQDLPAEKREKYVGITLEKAYRLEKMIDEFFEITRYNSQEITISKTSLDLSYMLVQLIDELHPVLSANGNTVDLQAEEDLTVCADPDKLARVFNNILKNAAAYSFLDSRITITAKNAGNRVCITFANKGRHIPQEQLASLFEKFYRLDESRTSHTGGAGLGLAIAKEIITLHGGTIIAESEGDNICFTVMLPKE
ncbi:MAG: HAMP domain-containing histidine kinase [Parasporobacterium sp.]|nr:HAMP domain-containing histidine kinase [Parasporobacterium sp.]